MKRMRDQSSSMAFNDMLFNILIGFVMLFIIAFLLINPITKKADVPTKAEVLVMLEWDSESKSDMDLWVMREGGRPIGFTHREEDNWFLDKDDLGFDNDAINIDGVATIIKVNHETISMRGILPGIYYIAVHSYSLQEEAVGMTLTVLDVNPYNEAYAIKKYSSTKKEITRFPAIEIDREGRIVRVFKHNKRVVPIRGSAAAL